MRGRTPPPCLHAHTHIITWSLYGFLGFRPFRHLTVTSTVECPVDSVDFCPRLLVGCGLSKPYAPMSSPGWLIVITTALCPSASCAIAAARIGFPSGKSNVPVRQPCTALISSDLNPFARLGDSSRSASSVFKKKTWKLRASACLYWPDLGGECQRNVAYN